MGTDADPDFKYYQQSGIFQSHTKTQFFWKFFLAPILCLKLFFNIYYLIFNRLLASSTKLEIFKIIIVQTILFLIGAYFVGYKFYFLYWLLPYFTIFQIITWFIELAEHYPMIQNAQSNLGASRNRFSHAVEAFL